FSYTPRTDNLPTEIRDARSKLTTQSYSVLGEILGRTRPLNIEFKYTYNKDRQQTFLGDGSDKGHDYSYGDGTLRVTGMTLRDGSSLTYANPDKRNLPQTITMPGGSKSLTYDQQGRILSEQTTYAGGNYQVSNAKYDALN